MGAASVTALLATSWWLVRRPGLLVPAGAALVLVVATLPVLDDGYALRVLRGAGVLLACAWTIAADDPSGEVLAASPYSRATRTAARLLAGTAVVVPTWIAAAALVQWRAPMTPVLGLGLEALTLGAIGLGVGTALRAWRDQHAPSHGAMLGLVALVFAAHGAPRWYVLLQNQTWGPPWEAAQIRWVALLLVGMGLVVLALRDPVGDEATRGT